MSKLDYEYKIDNNTKIIKGKFCKFSNFNKDYSNKIVYFEFFNINHINVIQNVKLIIVKEGGILNHALIVAREFKIPCIIGTNCFFNLQEDVRLLIDFNKDEYKVLK